MPDLLLELGSEEIPASFVGPALEQIERLFRERSAALGIKHGTIQRFGTPRRLAILVNHVIERTEDVTKHVQGPSVEAAFDAQGAPRTSALKFAESLKLPFEMLDRVQTPKGVYLTARIEEKGQPTLILMPEVIKACINGLVFPKSMRWGDGEASFVRPLHWIVALFGQEIVPAGFADVESGRTTRGHRFLAPEPIVIRSPEDYEGQLEKAHVIADIEKRKQSLLERVKAVAAKAQAEVLHDEALVDQVVNLVELPCPVVGTFDALHLDLPAEVLVQEMKIHQRYFPLVGGDGKLLPMFIAISNTPVKDEKLSVKGYERVLRARLTDGRFFFDEDRRIPLPEWLARLQRRTWVTGLGSMAEKSERIEALSVRLAEATGRGDLRATVGRAAALCKADLETGMVNEFPELQGVMGREYAKNAGEADDVALAIYEHYLPRGANDGLPTQDAGALVGLADRLDSLCGLFGIGKKPTGTKDDFALRRAAITLIRIVIARGYRFSLGGAIQKSLELLQPKLAATKKPQTAEAVQAQVLEFYRGRLEALWREDHRPDAVEAVLSSGFDDLVAAKLRLDVLSAQIGHPEFAAVIATFKRVANIVAKQAQDVAGGPVDAGLLTDPAEKSLHTEVESLQETVQKALATDDFAGALSSAFRLKSPVDDFFNTVMVMAEDRAVRENRVRLLMQIRTLINSVADFSKLQA